MNDASAPLQVKPADGDKAHEYADTLRAPVTSPIGLCGDPLNIATEMDHMTLQHKRNALGKGVLIQPLPRKPTRQPGSRIRGSVNKPRQTPTATVVRSSDASSPHTIAVEILHYQIDLQQRAVLFLDILRQRANNLLSHEAAGLPPLLHFEAETILDARTFERPANYALMRITVCGSDHLERFVRDDARPVIVIDPRAGHGPGIGGFKRDSEVGVALPLGHPVYFVVFFAEPCPNQTLGDVMHALHRFVESVAKRHPGKPPALYGNCQAGWAVALLSADCEGQSGPAVLNGSPLSYWAGAPEVNPMRLLGGLLGGAWITDFLADIGNDQFDGAWLVQNFENLNFTNALWEKHCRVFADPDGERERFLEFERWWSGFYFFSREEITAIVENLFLGNQLETGKLRICSGCIVDLQRIRNPLVIFASEGDNITPPHQALNWISAVYPTTQALTKAGQRIVYLVNPHVGHLGIFVSSSVALREHRTILSALNAIEGLTPGLYELIIESADGPALPVFRFERRRIEDVCFGYDHTPFARVNRVSERNIQFYRAVVSPWIKSMASPWSATLLKWFHPMRAGRWMFSERFNPWMAWVAPAAAITAKYRWQTDSNNRGIALERDLVHKVTGALEKWRRLRDATQEDLFRWIFGAARNSRLQKKRHRRKRPARKT